MSKFLLLSADPNAWKALREKALSEAVDHGAYQPSLAELLSLAAEGYQLGLKWNKSHMPENSSWVNMAKIRGSICLPHSRFMSFAGTPGTLVSIRVSKKTPISERAT